MAKKKGVVLIFIVMVITTMLILVVAITYRSMPEKNISQRFVFSTQAFELAETGIQKACLALNTGNWDSWGGVGTSVRDKSESLSGIGAYNVTVTNFASVYPVIISQGTVMGVNRSIEVTMRKDAFSFGLSAADSFYMGGSSLIDSYDSSKGAYGGGNVSFNGDVGVSGVSGTITVGDSAVIKGNLKVSPDRADDITLPESNLTGKIRNNNRTIMTGIVVPEDLIALSDGGNYSVTGHDVDIPSGNYKFSSLGIGSNGVLNIEGGTVRIYLTGSFTMSANSLLIIAPDAKLVIYTDGQCILSGNGIINQSCFPKNFQLYSAYSNPDYPVGVTITGNSSFYGVVYAPNTGINITGNADTYGAITGKDLIISGNMRLHYDKSLSIRENTEERPDSSHYSVKSWREQDNPYPLI